MSFDLRPDALRGRLYPHTVVAEQIGEVVHQHLMDNWHEYGLTDFSITVKHNYPPREW